MTRSTHRTVGRELFRCCVPFRKSILELDVIHERETGESLVRKYGLFDDGVTPESTLGDIWPIHVTLPALTMVQVALVDAFQAIGIQPDVVVGHSAGETAVLYASGAATKEQTLELSIARGRGMSFLESLGGSMAAINCSPADAERIIAQVVAELGPGSLEVGCYNDTDALTLSGLVTHLDRAVDIALEKGIFARKLKTRVAVHSSLMEGCREEYNQAVSDVFAKHAFGRPRTIVYSSATGDIMQEAASADYFWTNSRGPVRFDDAIRAIVQADERTCFLELGPHPVLSAYLSSLAPSAVVSCPLRRPNSKKPEKDVEIKAFLSSIAHLATTGHHADFAVLAGAGVRPLAVMPAYPFSRKSVPVMAPSNDMKRLTRPRNGPLNFPELHVNTQTHPSLADHLIQSEALMPAAGYMEMVS
jgi:acyl transferase domain-containing protein